MDQLQVDGACCSASGPPSSLCSPGVLAALGQPSTLIAPKRIHPAHERLTETYKHSRLLWYNNIKLNFPFFSQLNLTFPKLLLRPEHSILSLLPHSNLLVLPRPRCHRLLWWAWICVGPHTHWGKHFPDQVARTQNCLRLELAAEPRSTQCLLELLTSLVCCSQRLI